MPTIAQNTALMMVGSIGQKIISLVYFTFVARTIGVENTGLYTAALAMSTIFVVFVDLGFTNVFIREAARDEKKIQDYFSLVLTAKIICGVLSYGAMAVTLNLLDFEPEFTRLVYVSGLTMLFDSFHLTAYGALRAYGNLKYESLGMVLSQFSTLILGTVFLILKLPLIWLILAFTLSSLMNAIYAGSILHYRYNLSIKPRYNLERLRGLFYITVPFALAAIFGRIYSYVDIVMLKKLAGNAMVGYYSTPSKITFAFQFIPLALIASLYPRFSEYFAHDKRKLALTFEQSLKYLMLIAVPITVGIFILAPAIITFAFTDRFLPSVIPLRILIISLLFSFISFPVGAFLNAGNRQKTQTIITGGVLIVNVITNLLLIPRWGATGAALAALLSNLVLGSAGFAYVTRIAAVSFRTLAQSFFQIVLAATVMGLAVFYTNAAYGLGPALLAGVSVYGVMIFVVRVVGPVEIREALGMIKK